MTVGVGFIFESVFTRGVRQASTKYDPLDRYRQGPSVSSFFSGDLGLAILVTAPAIILHELMHKLVALGFGLEATFHAAYVWLGIGVILKLLNVGFIFFVPGYVSIAGLATPLQSALIAFAGPGTNLFLYGLSWIVTQNPKIPDI